MKAGKKAVIDTPLLILIIMIILIIIVLVFVSQRFPSLFPKFT